MRQSPTKVIFSYPNKRSELPLYSPQLIHSGYIVGEPVAYTDHPQLPPNYQSFSPKQRPRTTTSYPLNQSSHYVHDASDFKYQAPDPALFARPQRQSFRGNSSRKIQRQVTVSIQEYNLLRQKHSELQRKYKLLEQKYQKLTYSKGAEVDTNFDDRISKLIEVYKQNTLKETQLLIERYHLQSKEAQIDEHLKQ